MATSARLDELKKKFDENPRRYFAPLANEHRKLGDITQAIAICRAHLPNQVGHISGHIVLAQALYEARELGESRQIFEASLELDPENLIALRFLGDIAREQGDPGSARGWYERVLDADPRNDEIAQLLREVAGSTQTAVAELDQDFTTRPTPPGALAFSTATEDFESTFVSPAEAPDELEAPTASEATVDDWFASASTEVASAEPPPPHGDDLFPDLGSAERLTPQSAPSVADELSGALQHPGDAAFELEEGFGFEGPSPAAAEPRETAAPDRQELAQTPGEANASSLQLESASHEEPTPLRSSDSPSAEYSATLDFEMSDDLPPAAGEAIPPDPGQPYAAEETGAGVDEDDAVDAARATNDQELAFEDWQPPSVNLGAERSIGAEPPVDPLGNLELTESSAQDEGAEPDATAESPSAGTDPFAATDFAISNDEQPWEEPEVETLDGLVSMEAGAPPPDAEYADPSLSIDRAEYIIDDLGDVEPPRPDYPSTSFIADPIFGRTPILEEVSETPTPTGFVTETMAELYLQQGFTGEALAIYRELLDRNPDDATLRERVTSLERGPGDAEPDEAAVTPHADREGQSIRAFFAHFARRSPVRPSPRDGGDPAPDATLAPLETPRAGEPSSETSERFSGAATRAEALTVAEEGTAPTSSLSQLFQRAVPSEADEAAASSLSLAFGAPPEAAAGDGAETAPATAPATAREKELSLEHLFRDVPAHSAGAVTLDEFYASAPDAEATSVGERGEQPDERDADIEQFTTWLEGLKKK